MNAESSVLHAAQHQYTDFNALIEDYHARGWTDGLPIVPPTPDAVAQFLDAAGVRADDIIGEVTTRDIVATAEHVAINAVMAGCRADYMPVVLAAARAMLQPDANAHCVTATLAGAAQALIVNGPIRQQLDINSGLGCFGPGWRANATIGRALRLFVRNTLNSVPGGLDRGAFSQPARYSFCFGENEEISPWPPLHVERGFDAQQSTVSLWSMLTPVEVRIAAPTPDAIIDTLYAAIVQQQSAWIRHFGMNGKCDLILVMCPEHARCLGDAGWSKARVQQALFERLHATRIDPPDANFQETMRLGDPGDLHIVVAGGYGYFVTWLLTPHCSLLTTQLIQPR
jgi:hypothetical protein